MRLRSIRAVDHQSPVTTAGWLQLKPADLQALDGSDGARTRDLRRDRSGLEDGSDGQISLFDGD